MREFSPTTAAALATASGAVISLDDPRARDPRLAGAKAANLAKAQGVGLPVLPGYVLTTEATDPETLTVELSFVVDQLAQVASSMVVRSSSTVEDAGTSSMAGQFRSVLDVRGRQQLLDAIRTVLNSAHLPNGATAPMAVLIQPQVEAVVGGVMFGIDPVTGNERTIVVEAVAGSPDQLVSGQVSAQRLTLNRKGRLLAVDGVRAHHQADRGRRLLTTRDLHRLAALSGSLVGHYGCPQDVEWAIDPPRHLYLLQTRPVTAHAAPASGPTLGPGPIAETFPYPLRPLERDLWLTPMRDGIRAALSTVGVVPHHTLDSTPVLVDVAGWPAADLELFGYLRKHPEGWGWLDPRPPARRLAAAWRVGSLRARLAGDITDLVVRVDDELAAVPALSTLSTARLLTIIDALNQTLVELHTAEVLAASLTRGEPGSLAGAALDALRRGRGSGLTDAQIVRGDPVVLSLVPPCIGIPHALPATPGPPVSLDQAPPGLREQARLRVRWVHELQAKIASNLGERSWAAGSLTDPALVAWLTLDELHTLAQDGALPPDLAARATDQPGPPLPAQFRLASDGSVVPVERRGARPSGGVGAGGGRGRGTVIHADDVLPNAVADATSVGHVLVVRTLDPTLAARLPGLAGLIAESGSTLSHLAILAREYQVPTVVAVHDALHRFPAGSSLLVDGRTGEVQILEEGPT